MDEYFALERDERRGGAEDRNSDAAAVGRRRRGVPRLAAEQLPVGDEREHETQGVRQPQHQRDALGKVERDLGRGGGGRLRKQRRDDQPDHREQQHRAGHAGGRAGGGGGGPGTTASPAARSAASGGAASQASTHETGMATSSQRTPGIQNSTDSRTAVTGPTVVWSAVRRPAAADNRLEMRASTALATWLASSTPTTFWAVRNASSLRRIVSRNTSCSSGLLRHDQTKPGPTACCW